MLSVFVPSNWFIYYIGSVGVCVAVGGQVGIVVKTLNLIKRPKPQKNILDNREFSEFDSSNSVFCFSFFLFFFFFSWS